jgi:cell division protease FtsH
LAEQTPGFSGADIANICNEAALIGARKNKNCIEDDDFSEAIDRIIGGLERRGKIISEQEKQIIAHHESGHAVVSWFLKDAEQLVKLTIVPRGKSLGSAWYQPQEHALLTFSQLMANLSVAFGGRAAEELIFQEISSGAMDDLEKATKQAYTMVAYYGISKKVGNLSYYDSSGRNEQSLQKPYSESMAKLIDEEVKSLVDQAYQVSIKILKDHEEELRNLAALLLKKELLIKSDLENILGKRSFNQVVGKTKSVYDESSLSDKIR